MQTRATPHGHGDLCGAEFERGNTLGRIAHDEDDVPSDAHTMFVRENKHRSLFDIVGRALNNPAFVSEYVCQRQCTYWRAVMQVAAAASARHFPRE